MCLAVPARIVSIQGTSAVVDIGGVTSLASLMLVPGAQVDEWVLIHAGFAIETIDEGGAGETALLLRKLGYYA